MNDAHRVRSLTTSATKFATTATKMPKPRRRLFTECLEARDVPNASIAGSTFEDANLDGTYSQVVAAYVGAPPTENAVAGVTVELDLGGDGTYERTTTSDANGKYTFTDVPDGVHAIATTRAGFTAYVDLQGGERQPFPEALPMAKLS